MNGAEIDILRVAHQGFCCAQIMLQLALDLQGRENPGLIRAMAGLCHGLASTEGPCGVLTGGSCLIAYYAGKGRADDEADDKLPLLLGEFEEWFRETCRTRFGGDRCVDIVTGGVPDRETCGGLLAEAWNKAIALLQENGFDPTESKDHD